MFLPLVLKIHLLCLISLAKAVLQTFTRRAMWVRGGGWCDFWAAFAVLIEVPSAATPAELYSSEDSLLQGQWFYCFSVQCNPVRLSGLTVAASGQLWHPHCWFKSGSTWMTLSLLSSLSRCLSPPLVLLCQEKLCFPTGHHLNLMCMQESLLAPAQLCALTCPIKLRDWPTKAIEMELFLQ